MRVGAPIRIYHTPPAHPHPPVSELFITADDIDETLTDYGEAIDISRDDLDRLFQELLGALSDVRLKRRLNDNPLGHPDQQFGRTLWIGFSPVCPGGLPATLGSR